MSALFLFFLLLIIGFINSDQDYVIRRHVIPGDINHIAYARGNIYVTSGNTLYVYSKTFDVIEETELSLIPPKDEEYEDGEFDNILLVVDEESQKIVVCTTQKRGVCQIRNLNDITEVEGQTSKDYTSGDKEYPNFGVIVPSVDGEQYILYMASTLHAFDDWTGAFIPVISIFYVSGFDLINYGDANGFSSYLRVDPSPDNESEFNNLRINFVHIFVHDGYTFFLQSSVDFDHPGREEVAMLGRLCHSSKYSNGYVEIKLICQENYNIPRAATVGNINGRESLIVTFSKDRSSSPDSAVCIYTLEEIQTSFTRNIEVCYEDGSGNHTSRFGVFRGGRCSSNPAVTDICDINPSNLFFISPLTGSISLAKVASITYDKTILTSIVTLYLHDGKHVFYIATSNGYIKKVGV